jgi:hypothetical protein
MSAEVIMKAAKVIKLGGEQYKLTLFRIISRYEDGTPEVLNLVTDLQTCELSENPDQNHFLTAYMPDIDFSSESGKIPTI